MIGWVIEGDLARSARPGYVDESDRPVDAEAVAAWIDEAKSLGVRSIICLLHGQEQLRCYEHNELGLLQAYRAAGFEVRHLPVRDHRRPPLTDEHHDRIWEAYRSLDKPVLVHCSAGVDRTGSAVDEIVRRRNEADG